MRNDQQPASIQNEGLHAGPIAPEAVFTITFQDDDTITIAASRNGTTVEFTADREVRDWGLAGEDNYPAAEAAAKKLGYARPEDMWPAIEPGLNRAAGFVRPVAVGLSEKGRRALAHFLADNLKDDALRVLVATWEQDIVFGRGGELRGDLEVEGFYSSTKNPATIWFEGDELSTEDEE